ncbi:L-aspartate oxidase [Tepidibacter hydrothermalis]|uniref:L-aspartate oxidase n=1 Tax=Tepidibacter hydrothermalis TaxID=3036126 RepID=A0ABY8EAG1_9FIRM|nr:L-aspartate oxidase [Tepidibacter hydrothermalis]WFD08905.1 L-aspartate oxidase [Tepidibacter hydrothermalis]
MKVYADVLIVGTGIAGLYSALNLRNNLKIVMITKEKVDDCNSYLAQGGIATAKDKYDIENYVQDTLKAGQYKNNEEAVRILAEESIDNINNLIKLGVKFDTVDGELRYTREAAHCNNRIVHCKDRTGGEVFNVLLKRVKEKSNIQIIEESCLIDIIEKNNICSGGIAVKDNEVINIYSKVTILACGGIGGLFKNSTNVKTLTGDGISIACKHKINIRDINYIQFHPTSLYEKGENRRFLISEAVRGEGAYLLNKRGIRFVDELLPRDVVSKAILNEELKSNSECVFLDITHKNSQYIVDRFPSIYEACINKGIDMTKDRIPVTPAQHYFMGGITVDTYSRTSMKRLFACGEVSCTGVHGANRLASNSLQEALVFSRRASIIINNNIDDIQFNKLEIDESYNCVNASNIKKQNIKIALNELIKVRGDLKNELVNC